MSEAKRQCDPCTVDQPYEKEIDAGGVLCGGCGRIRPNTKYILKSVLTELAREVEARMKQGRRRASMGDGRLSQIALIEAREDENILAIIRSKKGGGK